MKSYWFLFLILVCPITHSHENSLHDAADQATAEETGDFYKSTKNVPYEFVDIDGGGSYGAVRLSFAKTDTVGMVGKYWSSKGVQFTRHTHTDWVVVTVLNGEVQVARNNGADIRVYLPGDSYLVEPGETHVETSLEDTEVVVVNGPGVNNEKFNMRTIDIDSADN